MAKNRNKERGNQFSIAVPDGTKSGDPLVIGILPCVALTDKGAGGNISTEATVQTDGTWDLPVHAYTNNANAAVAAGAILYLDGTEVNLDSTNGKRFGYAVGAVASGETQTIEVKLGY